MKSQFPPETPFPSAYNILLLILFIQFPSISGNNTEWYTSCRNLFSCGGINGVDYPFWGGKRPQDCGHPGLELMCEDDTPTIEIMNVKYQVLQVNPSTQILRIGRRDFAINDICPENLVNTTLDSNLFEYASGYVNLTIQYGCPPLSIPVPAQITCNINGITYQNVYVVPGAQGPGTCRASIFFPIHSTAFGGINEVLPILGQEIGSGFEVRWKVDSTQCNECRNSNGSCGYDLKSNQFTCLCPGNQSSGHYGCTSVSTDEPIQSMVVSEEPRNIAEFNTVISLPIPIS